MLSNYSKLLCEVVQLSTKRTATYFYCESIARSTVGCAGFHHVHHGELVNPPPQFSRLAGHPGVPCYIHVYVFGVFVFVRNVAGTVSFLIFLTLFY